MQLISYLALNKYISVDDMRKFKTINFQITPLGFQYVGVVIKLDKLKLKESPFNDFEVCLYLEEIKNHLGDDRHFIYQSMLNNSPIYYIPSISNKMYNLVEHIEIENGFIFKEII